MLGKAIGIYDIDFSNDTFGSYISVKNLNRISKTNKIDIDTTQLKSRIIENTSYIDEIDIHRYLKKSNNFTYDEIVLKTLIKNKYSNSVIETQKRVGLYKMDLYVNINGVEKFIEFDGPCHFSLSKYGTPKNHPFKKKFAVEDKTGIEVINWGYWIHKCEKNLEIIFNDDKKFRVQVTFGIQIVILVISFSMIPQKL
jgi:hypothetical protein